MRRLLFSLIVVSSISTSVIALSGAFFTDSEISQDNTFQAGALDLLIDSECHYWQDNLDVGCGVGEQFGNWEASDLGVHKFFNFYDIKPGDYGEDTISMRVETNNAWVCSDITLTANKENGFTEPESLVDTLEDGDFDGELAQNLEFLFWGDDGDNVLESNEYASVYQEPTALFDLVGLDKTYSLAVADSENNIWGAGGPITGMQTYYIGAAWCFGNFELTPLSQTDSHNPSLNPGFACDGIGQSNITQTDIVTADIGFQAVQARHNDGFLCGGEEQCSYQEETWVTEVVDSSQGTKKNGDPVDLNRSDPNTATGEAEGTNAAGTFYSLGFGGSITLKFNHAIEDLEGVDLSFHEITNDPYPEESADIFVSQNGSDFELLGSVSNVGTPLQYLDLSTTSFDWIQYVQVVDTSDPSVHNDNADGYDLDGLDGQNYNVCL